PLPLALRSETVTEEPPLLVMVSDRLWLLPVVTLPKLRLVGLAEMAPAETPVPDRLTVVVDPAAVMVTLPLAEPVAVGAKVTLKLADCPGFRVTGSVRPLTL